MNALNITLLQAAQQQSSWSGIFMIILIFVVFWLFFIRPQNKRAKEQQKFRENLQKGDKVITIGGIHGKVEEVREIFNKKSGLLGISCETSDWRGITKGYLDGEKRATLAFEMFCYRLAKFIASYYVPLGHVDAIVFTGGIGENSYLMRKRVIELLPEVFGIKIDEKKNEAALVFKGGRGEISTPDSKVRVVVVPTNEELVIAQSAAKFAK